jgi:hypothetical protein
MARRRGGDLLDWLVRHRRAARLVTGCQLVVLGGLLVIVVGW